MAESAAQKTVGGVNFALEILSFVESLVALFSLSERLLAPSLQDELEQSARRFLQAARQDGLTDIEGLDAWLSSQTSDYAVFGSDPSPSLRLFLDGVSRAGVPALPTGDGVSTAGTPALPTGIAGTVKGKPWLTILLGRTISRPSSAELVNRAILISAVSSFEALIGDVVRKIYAAKPSLASGGREYSLADILDASVEDLIKDAIEHRVEMLMRDEFSSWKRWLQEKSGLNLDMASYSMDWPATCEIFYRRNAIIHTRSRVNKKYLQMVPDAPGIGTELRSDEEYLRRALENLLCLGALTAVEAWTRLDPGSAYLSGQFAALVAQDAWTVKMYRASAKMNRILCARNEDVAKKESFRLAEWMSRWLTGDQSVVEELRNSPFGTGDSRWALIRKYLTEPRTFGWLTRMKEDPAALRSALREMNPAHLDKNARELRAILLGDTEAILEERVAESVAESLEHLPADSELPDENRQVLLKFFRSVARGEYRMPEELKQMMGLSATQDGPGSSSASDHTIGEHGNREA